MTGLWAGETKMALAICQWQPTLVDLAQLFQRRRASDSHLVCQQTKKKENPRSGPWLLTPKFTSNPCPGHVLGLFYINSLISQAI